MCRAAGCRFVSVECACTDAAEHRARFKQRQGPRGPDRPDRDWSYVTATIRHYRADPGADFRADAIPPVADLVADILAIAGDGTAP